MRVSLLVAMAENGVIGRDGHLPWHLPADLKRFKRLTTGHVIIMGRKTFESIGRPLPKRRSVVITRNPRFQPQGVAVVHSLDEALRTLRGEDEVFVIGGAEIFELALARADRLYLTRVHADVEGDVRLPQLDLGDWRLTASERHQADPRHACAFSFEQWDRRLS
ncbi:MAG: dihydrofolate reductase [Thermoanaerobaculia bacterium]